MISKFRPIAILPLNRKSKRRKINNFQQICWVFHASPSLIEIILYDFSTHDLQSFMKGLHCPPSFASEYPHMVVVHSMEHNCPIALLMYPKFLLRLQTSASLDHKDLDKNSFHVRQPDPGEKQLRICYV